MVSRYRNVFRADEISSKVATSFLVTKKIEVWWPDKSVENVCNTYHDRENKKYHQLFSGVLACTAERKVSSKVAT